MLGDIYAFCLKGNEKNSGFSLKCRIFAYSNY